MCGIFGLIDTPWRDAAPSALDALASRGPDDAGFWNDERAWLGHRRLSIIDLAGGHQPMLSADGRHAIVFNGEIYNFAQLRDELLALGFRFRSRSDTEVLLLGCAAWGAELLPKLDGMFAFAVWDRSTRSLFAARDRIGIKPFFYSSVQGFAFASTLAPFLALPGFPRHLDAAALRDYLAFQAVLAPASFLREVRQLPPAGWLRYDAETRRLDQGRYWEIPPPARESGTPEELAARVDGALAESVRRQLVADVPLGAFLSGGVDSALMVRYMAEAGARPLKTFSMRFAEEGYDETGAALAVAAAFGTEHHVLEAPHISGASFARAVADLDQPLADPAYVMTWELSRQTRQHVTVAVSGDGGDELFAGYGRYRETEERYPQRPGQAALRRLIGLGLAPGALLRRSLWGQEMLLYRRVELGPWPGSRKSLARYLSPVMLAAAGADATLAAWRELALSFGGRMDTASLMRADLWTYLSENCLAKSDRASMAHGLEMRVPMLGNPVLEAVLHLPAAAHFDSAGKAILRRIARRSLPEAVWNRPKHGFSVPLRAYFNGAWREVCESAVERCQRTAPFLDAGAVRTLWRGARSGRASRRLAYTFVVLLLWLERHRIDADGLDDAAAAFAHRAPAGSSA